MTKVNVYEMVTNRIIEELEKGVIPWRRPWHGTLDGAYSRSTKKPYSLLNQMLLGMPGEWLTFNQIKQLGGSVKKGAKSKIVVFWSPIKVKETDKDGNENEKIIPYLKYYNVFHISQTTGIEPLSVEEEKEILKPIEKAENVINAYVEKSGISFNAVKSNEAYYSPSNDKVVVPELAQYDDESEYYSTAFHELTHSTGHSSRLNRVMGTVAFGSEDYSKEELVAEIGAAALCHTCGIETKQAFKNSAAYIQSWLKALHNDKRLIVSASGQAQKAVDMILN